MMSTIQDAIKSVQDYGDQFKRTLERHRGFLGDGAGTVYVADRDGYVYVRHRQAESADITGSMEPEEVIYSRADIPPIEGYPVIFGRDMDTENFQILAHDSEQLLGWIFDKYIKDHHEQHEFNEYDTVWIQKQAILPLLVHPTSPASTLIKVYSGWYQWDTDWHYFETTTSAELSSYVPTAAGQARFLLICIDGETETLHYEAGDTFLEYIPPRDCEDRIPPPPDGKIPLAAIYLVVGETSLDWDIIYDVRLLFSGGGSMSTGSAPRDASYVTMGLNATLSDERVLVAGAGITLADGGAGGNATVGLDDHDHAGLAGGDGGIIPGTSVELPEIGTAAYDDVTDWFNTTQSAGCLSGGAITDNGDGTIDVAAGNGYIKTSDAHLGDTKFFDYPATAAPLVPVDNAKNWVYVDYSAGTPVAKITDDKAILNRNTMFTIARLYREGNTLHIIEKGQCAYNLSMRAHRNLVEIFHYQRGSGLATAEKNARYLTVTAGALYRGLNEILTSAIDTSLTGTSFTYYYRDGGGGWTTGTASQIDNVNYDDGDGVLGQVTVNQYGVFWVYVDFDSHLFVQYGQDSYKLAAAQDSLVPDPPDLLDGFAMLVARIIVKRNSANLKEIAYPWEEIFMPQAATDHNQLGNLQGGLGPDEYYHLDQTAYAELSGGLGGLLHNDLGGLQGGQANEYYHLTQAQHTSFTVVAGAGYALVSTGANVWAADQTPLWLGTHTWGSGLAIMPTDASGQDLGDATHRWDLHTQTVSFENLTAGNNSIVIPDGLADALHVIDNGGVPVEFLRLDTNANYFLVDPAGAGIKVGIGITGPKSPLEVATTTGGIGRIDVLRIAEGTDALNNIAGIAFSTRGDISDRYVKSAIFHKQAADGNWGLGSLVFAVDSNADAVDVAAGDEKMRITSAGKVGIDTTAPQELLQVSDWDTIGDHYLLIGSDGGSLYQQGIKLRAHSNAFGFTIEADDTSPAGLNILRHDNSVAGASALWITRSTGNVGIGCIPNSLMEWGFATEHLEFVDAGSAGATEQDWVEVEVGGVQGYIRVFAAK